MIEKVAAQTNGAKTEVLAMKPVAAYVLIRTVIGTLRAALMAQSAYLGTPEFGDELVMLVHLLLAA